MKINKNADKSPVFETADFYLSVYMYAKGFDFVGAKPDQNDSRRQIFIFNTKESKALELQQSYYDGTGMVSMKKVKHAINDLKSIIHQNK